MTFKVKFSMSHPLLESFQSPIYSHFSSRQVKTCDFLSPAVSLYGYMTAVFLCKSHRVSERGEMVLVALHFVFRGYPDTRLR